MYLALFLSLVYLSLVRIFKFLRVLLFVIYLFICYYAALWVREDCQAATQNHTELVKNLLLVRGKYSFSHHALQTAHFSTC